MKAEGQTDVGLYLRIPVELDRRIRAAAVASADGGYLRHGGLKPFVIGVLARGLGVLEDARRELEPPARPAVAAKKRSKVVPAPRGRLGRLPRKRRR